MSGVNRPNTYAVGIVVVLLALWGGLIPFVGPLVGYDMGTDGAWTWTESRATLHVIPAIFAVLGGLLLLIAGRSAVQWLGSALAIGAGAWFIIAPSLRPIWDTGEPKGGMSGMGTMVHSSAPAVSPTRQALESLGYHYGIGALILGVGAATAGLLAASAMQERTAASTASRWETASRLTRPAATEAR